MARDIGIPHGSKISSFIGWLEELGYVTRIDDVVTKAKAYTVKSPLSLIDFFSRYRKMDDLKLDSFELGIDRYEVMKYLKSKGVIFCLTTALSYYDEYFRDPLIDAYLPDLSVLEDVSKKMGGNVKVNFYSYDVTDKPQIRDSFKISSEIRTVIDLYCDNKAYAANTLAKRIWGNE